MHRRSRWFRQSSAASLEERILVSFRQLTSSLNVAASPGSADDSLTPNSTYVDIYGMPRKPNSSAQARTLLSAMLRQPRTWQYGYELSKQTGLGSGTLYPLLIRLSDQGLLESQWQDPARPGKPPRHAYKLTPTGLAFARTITSGTTFSAVRRKIAGAIT